MGYGEVAGNAVPFPCPSVLPAEATSERIVFVCFEIECNRCSMGACRSTPASSTQASQVAHERLSEWLS